MRLAIKEGVVKCAKASRRGPIISYFLFADDCILFGEASEKGATTLKVILKEYEECLGQCVNFNKSTIFYSSNTSERRKAEVSTILGVQSSTNLEKYIGLPNVVGRKKSLFKTSKRRSTQESMDGVQEFYHNEVRKFL